MFTDLFKSKTGIMLVSILWGLGLAALFRQACKGNNCRVITAPDPSKVKKNIYQFADDKCYKFDTEVTECNQNPVN